MDLFRASKESSLGLRQESGGAKGILLPTSPNTVLSYRVCRSPLCHPSPFPSSKHNRDSLHQPQHRPQCDSKGAEQNTLPVFTSLGNHRLATHGRDRPILPSLRSKPSNQGTGATLLVLYPRHGKSPAAGKMTGSNSCIICPNSPRNLLVSSTGDNPCCPTCSTRVRVLLFCRQYLSASSWGGTWSLEDNKHAVTAASQPRGTPQHSHHSAQRHSLPQESLRSQLTLS